MALLVQITTHALQDIDVRRHALPFVGLLFRDPR